MFTRLFNDFQLQSDVLSIGSAADLNTFKGCLRQPKLRQKISQNSQINLATELINLQPGCRYASMKELALNGTSGYGMVM